MRRYFIFILTFVAGALALRANITILTTNARFSGVEVLTTDTGRVLTGFVQPSVGIAAPISAHVDVDIDGRNFRSNALVCRHPRTTCSDRHRFSIELPAGVDVSHAKLSYHLGTHG